MTKQNKTKQTTDPQKHSSYKDESIIEVEGNYEAYLGKKGNKEKN